MVLISVNAICYRVSPIRHRDELPTNNACLVVKCEYNQLIANGWILQNKCALKPTTERSWKLRILNCQIGVKYGKIIAAVGAVSKFQSPSVKFRAKLVGAITKLIGRKFASQPLRNAHQLSSRSGRNKKENTFLDEQNNNE